MIVVSNTVPGGITWDYDRGELIADGIVHAIGLSLGLAGVAAILIVAVRSENMVDLSSIVIYATGLLAMLGFSAAYNVWPISRAKWILRRFDHSAIYVMIAGSYMPFLAHMKSEVVSIGFATAIWFTAAIGVALKMLWPGRFDRLAIVVYLLLGWSGIVVYQKIASELPSLSIWLLIAGGALYSIGTIFHGWHTLRFQNAIWHSFVLIAACCHYSAILYSVAFA
jgi:hemolysin III